MCCFSFTGPDYSLARLIDHRMREKQFGFQVFEGFVIEVKLPPEGAVGQTASTLQHGDCLVKYLFKRHALPSDSCLSLLGYL